MRLQNWPILLSEYIRSRKSAPFEWGKNDCMTFMADGVLALTGRDFWEDFRVYDEKEAISRLRNKSIERWISDGIGHKGESNILNAKRGDIAMMKLPTGKTAGLINDSGDRIACVTKDGMITLPIRMAWRIWSY